MYLVLLHYTQGFQGQEIENDRIRSAGRPRLLVFAVSLLIGSEQFVLFVFAVCLDPILLLLHSDCYLYF